MRLLRRHGTVSVSTTEPRTVFEWGRRTYVMGVLNVTPDSFSDGGLFADTDAAVAQAHRMAADGADILDIGGESTRPATFGDKSPLPAEEELRRVLPVIARLTHELPHVPLSIDTYKAEVARAALDAGAAIVNDISGLTYDPAMASLVAERGVPLVLMHLLGRPKDIPLTPVYDDVVADLRAFFARADLARPRHRVRQDDDAQLGNPAPPAGIQGARLSAGGRGFA